MQGLLPRIGALLALLFAPVFATTVRASQITPGSGALPPDIFGFVCPGATCPTLMATISTDFTSANVKILGTFTAAVYSDPTNPFGAGDLDFVYQVQNSATSPDAIARISAIDFTGWMIDVGYTASGADLGFQDGEIALN